MIALTDPATIAVVVAAAAVCLGALVVLRLIMRREPSPAGWRRYRLGIFVERDPRDDEPPDGSR